MKFWDRVKLSFGILRGTVRAVPDHDGLRFHCAKQHPEGSQVLVNRDELAALRRAADELKIARGYIACAQKQEYQKAVKESQ